MDASDYAHIRLISITDMSSWSILFLQNICQGLAELYIYIEYLGNHQKYRVRYGSLVIVMCGLYGNHCTHTVHIQHISGYKWYLQ